MRNQRQIVKLTVLCAVVACLGLLLDACKDNVEDYNIDFRYSYYPVDSGHYLVYDVDSIFSYNSNFEKDTVSYQMMEVVGDTFYDGSNELNYELNIYRRPNSNSQWTYDRKWYVKKTNINIQKSEDDIRFVKVVFPPANDMTWNGNIYVPTSEPYRDFKDWEYRYDKVDEPYQINGFNFDSSVTVVCVNDSTFVSKHLRKEVYAKHVGLVFEEFQIKQKQFPEAWDTGRWTGFSIQKRLVEHN